MSYIRSMLVRGKVRGGSMHGMTERRIPISTPAGTFTVWTRTRRRIEHVYDFDNAAHADGIEGLIVGESGVQWRHGEPQGPTGRR